jgi:hypothetical protein
MKRIPGLFFAALLYCSGAYAQGWKSVGTSNAVINATHEVVALCADNGALYAGVVYGEAAAGSYMAYIARWNGGEWQRLGPEEEMLKGTGAFPRPICVDKAHNVYANRKQPGSDKSCVMKWNGTDWSELGTGSNALNTYNGVHTFCTDKDGNIYAAGALTDSGVYNVARWNGTSWSQLGTAGSALNANDWIMALAADSRGNIYAAGAFTQSGHLYVAKWDGTSWSSLDTAGIWYRGAYGGDGIRALYIDGADNIYASGDLMNAKNQTYVAKWDGTSWTDLGSAGNSQIPSHGPIDVICGDNAGNIYIAGVGLRQYNWSYCAKRLSGTSWDEVGIGSSSINVKGRIAALCTDSLGNLYAAGYGFFDNNKDAGKINVAKFNTIAAIKNNSGAEQIHAWPNPAHDELFIEVKEYGEYYSIYDIRGALMKSMQNKMTGAATNYMTIQELPKGTYFLKKENAIPFVFKKL